ncbi:TPA: hypothetical protein K8N36_003224 [Clostridium perfringens]|jgi:transposase-like protein|uniref:Uncharacterized protein n=2 Tax=Clostridium perfringens TaxID=1502 RepID=A0ABD4PXK8_CLOPF|nr:MULTISPECIES: hypothetical protein [Clostridium]EDT13977.1 hypothetical protein AC3_1823 [Clostridium perfringens E str. JGS1987]EDT26160.1 hypothetical protein AC5_1733 [Clostridium perfringens CPE str. F4969]EGT0681997.1 hypothetical protein [Clostridium perfringens]EGT0692760.1 hypothetical protein [Clostridium perfringens]EGT4144721.1 hypothetical protein [Clostridium perfringens]
MSLSFNSTFGNKSIKINCPICKSELEIKLNQVGTEIHCPFCRKTIALKAGTNFEKSKSAIDNEFKSLNKTLKNFGK